MKRKTRPTGVAGALRAREAAEGRVASMRLEYERLYDAAPVIWIILDSAGIIRGINLEACRALQLRRSFAVGTPLRMWIASNSQAALRRHLHETVKSSDMVSTDLSLKTQNGNIIPVRLTTQRCELGEAALYPTVAVDISESVRLKEELAATTRQLGIVQGEYRDARDSDASKDRLIAIVSHELRNPLSPALFAASSLVKWPSLPERVREMAAVIQRNVQLEARLIDDLLDVARVTRGQLDLRTNPVDVHKVLQRAIEACGTAARDRSITFDVVLAAASPWAVADEARIQQVFWNVLSNAVKFSNPGGQVLVRTHAEASGVLTVRIRDFGIGIDGDTLTQLFSPFERPTQPKATRAGLGLGLTIARGIVEAHGGAIWASSEGPDQGSTFEIQLPTCAMSGAEEGRPVGSSSSLPDRSSFGRVKRGRILLIEDHQDTGSLLALFLSRHEYQVRLASTLAEGLSALEEEWDAVLSDIGLEDGSGLEVARYLEQRTDRPGIVVALSGYGSQSDIVASLDAGFDRHLVKPVDPNELLKLLEEAGRGGRATAAER